jgi:arginyl-tRNA--protein-N-Asp/Glu arginylyltransferase
MWTLSSDLPKLSRQRSGTARLGTSRAVGACVTSSLRDLKVYTTYPHRCSYLEGEEATTLFIDPRQSVDKTLYSNLSMLGFRRSGNHIYRPHCSHCNACIPARVPVDDFRPTAISDAAGAQCRSRRPRRKTMNDDESYALYDRYIAPATPTATCTRRIATSSSPSSTIPGAARSTSVPQGGRTRGGGRGGRDARWPVRDLHLLRPGPRRRSLGRYAILWQIERCREGLPYVYLGYWIRNCRKMAYKADYQPLELLVNNQWQRGTEGLSRVSEPGPAQRPVPAYNRAPPPGRVACIKPGAGRFCGRMRAHF